MPQFDITIAGELNLDIILYGLPEELPFEQELLASGLMVTLGSSSAITAHNLAVLGTRVGFVTRLGEDALGKIALERLRAAAVDLTRITRSSTASTGLTVLLPYTRQRRILTYPGCMAEMTLAHLDLAYPPFVVLSSPRASGTDTGTLPKAESRRAHDFNGHE